MPPKAAASEKTFSQDTMGGLLASLIKRGVTVGNADFLVMAKVDTNVTASSLEHQFRGLKKQAAEIAKTLEGDSTPIKAAKTPKTTTPDTGKKRGTCSLLFSLAVANDFTSLTLSTRCQGRRGRGR